MTHFIFNDIEYKDKIFDKALHNIDAFEVYYNEKIRNSMWIKKWFYKSVLLDIPSLRNYIRELRNKSKYITDDLECISFYAKENIESKYLNMEMAYGKEE